MNGEAGYDCTRFALSWLKLAHSRRSYIAKTVGMG